MSIFIGIDPGLDGALVAIHEDGRVQTFETPTTAAKPREYLEREMVAILGLVESGGHRRVAAIEYAQAMPRQGVRSMFSIGLGYGMWRGILAGLGIPYDIVRPQQWRKSVGLPAKADKAASVALAARLFPAVADALTGPRGGLRDGVAEALLIAEYRRRIG